LGLLQDLQLIVFPKPKSVNVCLLGTTSFEKVNQILQHTFQNLGEVLSAYEFFDNECLNLVKSCYGYPHPLSNSSPFYILLELAGSNENHDKEKLESLIKILMEKSLIEDGTIAEDKTKILSLWKYREDISVALSKSGFVYKYDISLPREKKMYEIVEIFRERLKDEKGTEVYGYGHIGDGNLHLNILSQKKAIQSITKYTHSYMNM